jgi:hypothetical protein
MKDVSCPIGTRDFRLRIAGEASKVNDTNTARKLARSIGGVAVLVVTALIPAIATAQAVNDAREDAAGAKIEVIVDPRVEAISILFRLAGNNEYRQCRLAEYDKAIREHFDEHSDHEAVRFAKELRSRRGVGYDAPMALAVQLEKGFSFRSRKPLEAWPWGIDARWTREDVEAFLEKLRLFAKDTEFERFFAERKPLYERLAAVGRKGIAEVDLKGWFDGFFGARSDTVFRLVMAPTNGPSNYGTRYEPVETGEPREVYAILGIWATDASGNAEFAEGQLSTVVHEFCHSYVNPIVDAHLPELRAAGERIFPKVEEQMRAQAYPSWEIMMRESGVRACETWFVGDRFGEARRRASIAYQEGRGFLWTGDLVALLDTFAGEREKYPTFEAFFPRFVEFFEAYAEKIETVGLPTPTTINEVYRERSSVAFVVPTHEGDRNVEKAIRDYVTSIRDRLLPEAPVLTDDEALERDLSGNSLAVYGTMKGNSWLAKNVTKHPVAIEPGKIVAGSTFEGENLRFISCWPHPSNPERGIVIYTAQRAEDVVGINDLFHGPTGWVVAEGSEVKKAADYVVTDEGWKFE